MKILPNIIKHIIVPFIVALGVHVLIRKFTIFFFSIAFFYFAISSSVYSSFSSSCLNPTDFDLITSSSIKLGRLGAS